MNGIKAMAEKILNRWRYSSPDGYNAKRYWRDRHSKYRFNLQGVGNKTLSVEDNRNDYLEARSVFLSLCRDTGLDLSSSKLLDVGCGTGFYAEIFMDNGGTHYLGVDIVDVLFDDLRSRFPGYRFRKLDVAQEEIGETFDLIVMIDVTQHITSDPKFSYAMRNVRASLSERGVFVVTSWLEDGARNSFYEVSRSMDRYKAEFPGFEFSPPVPFRDKFIFSVRKPRGIRSPDAG